MAEDLVYRNKKLAYMNDYNEKRRADSELVRESNAQTLKHYHDHPEKVLERRRRYAERIATDPEFARKARENSRKCQESRTRRMTALREEMFKLYGSTCACCGESCRPLLSLQHKNGGGNEDRRRLGQMAVIQKAVAENDTSKYEVLCHNCNWAEDRLGGCPHKAQYKVPSG